MPPTLGSTALIRRLLLITVIEMDGQTKGIADLRPLQRMTNLRELRILFTTRKFGQEVVDFHDRADSVFKAIIECIPGNAIVHYDIDDPQDEHRERRTPIPQRSGSEYENIGYARWVLDAVKEDMPALEQRKGKLSGSEVNHAMCSFGHCLEGLGCVNSQCAPAEPMRDSCWKLEV